MRGGILLHPHLKYHMAQASVRLNVTYASGRLVRTIESAALMDKKT